MKKGIPVLPAKERLINIFSNKQKKIKHIHLQNHYLCKHYFWQLYNKQESIASEIPIQCNFVKIMPKQTETLLYVLMTFWKQSCIHWHLYMTTFYLQPPCFWPDLHISLKVCCYKIIPSFLHIKVTSKGLGKNCHY